MEKQLEKQKESLVRYWQKHRIIKDKKVLEAFLKTPRENFIAKEQREYAYIDRPLPIFGNQAISQPTTIVMMLQALELKKNDRVLEIGAGSGYNASLIANVCSKGFVYTTEIVPELFNFAKENIRRLKIKNIEVILADGSVGYEAAAPYDKIISTAATPKMPNAWIKQLNIGGIIVAPVGPAHIQKILKLKKLEDEIQGTNLEGNFTFVPLKGEYGHK